MSEIEATIDNNCTCTRVANISWTAPINNADLDYYAISVDDGPPMSIKNTSIQYHLNSSNSEHYISLRAVDRCGQQGTDITIQVTPGNEMDQTVTYNGVIRITMYVASNYNLICR